MAEIPFDTGPTALILEGMPDAVQALDRDWRYVYVNRRQERLLGRPREELLGRVCWEMYPEAVGTPFHARFLDAMATGETVVIEEFCPHDETWVEFTLHPHPAGLVSFNRDITDRKKAEEERERLLGELREANERQRQSLNASEERFRLLVSGVRDYAIFLLDPQGNVATWNAGAERFKGYKAGEIIGKHFSTFYTPEDVARRHPWNELEVAEREGKYEEEGWRVRKDGSRFWASVVITALRDEAGELKGFAKVTRDFTERRERERERAAVEASEQQRRFLKQVLASVTQGSLILCETADELPPPVSAEPLAGRVPVTRSTLKDLRARVLEAAAACGLPRGRTHDLLTGAGEASMNAVVHGGGGEATLYADAEGGVVQVWIADGGGGIDLGLLPRATLERGFSSAGTLGHGFWLMLRTIDRVYLLTGPEGTTVVLEQWREVPQPGWLGGA